MDGRSSFLHFAITKIFATTNEEHITGNNWLGKIKEYISISNTISNEFLLPISLI